MSCYSLRQVRPAPFTRTLFLSPAVQIVRLFYYLHVLLVFDMIQDNVVILPKVVNIKKPIICTYNISEIFVQVCQLMTTLYIYMIFVVSGSIGTQHSFRLKQNSIILANVLRSPICSLTTLQFYPK